MHVNEILNRFDPLVLLSMRVADVPVLKLDVGRPPTNLGNPVQQLVGAGELALAGDVGATSGEADFVNGDCGSFGMLRKWSSR